MRERIIDSTVVTLCVSKYTLGVLRTRGSARILIKDINICSRHAGGQADERDCKSERISEPTDNKIRRRVAEV